MDNDVKVGDKVIHNSVLRSPGTILAITGTRYKIKWDDTGQCFDGYGRAEFFIMPTQLPPYQVGDRVQRTSVDTSPQHRVPAGSEGTVNDVSCDQVIITWDHLASEGPFPYAWPQRAAYFSKLTTGQTRKRALHCIRCKEYDTTGYAAPNQPDGVSFKCWLCQKYPYR